MAHLSAFADEASPMLDQQIEFLRSQNVNYIEIRFVDGVNILDLNKDQLSTARQMLDDAGIRVSALGSPIGKVRLDEPFGPHLDKFKHAVDVALQFQTRMIRVFSYYPPEGENIDNCKTQVLDRLEAQLDCISDVPVVMVHENETGIFGYSAGNCALLAESLASEKFRLAFDSGNFVWGQNITDSIESCWPVMKPYVEHIHIKDWTLGQTIAAMPGTGQGQIPELLAELAAVDYAGYITMEPHLEHGGQFGGKTSPPLYGRAIEAVRELASRVNLNLQ